MRRARSLVAALAVGVLLIGLQTSIEDAAGMSTSTPTAASGDWSDAVSADPNEGRPVSIFCVASGFCAVGDEYGGVVLRKDGAWNKPPRLRYPYEVEALSCASASICVGIGGFNEYARSTTYDGTSWSEPDSLSLEGTDAISCVSSTFCLGVDVRGHYATFDGAAWSEAATFAPYGLTDVDCVSVTFCVASGTR